MKTLTTLFLTAVSSVMLAQIPNPGFENWTGTNPTATPTSWYDLNIVYSGSVIESTTAHSGNSAAQLESVSFSSSYYGGVLTSGSPSNFYFGTGSVNNPAALTGWYELNLNGGDELQAIVLTKAGGVTNGGGSAKYTGTVSAWKQFSVCLSYTSGTADSAEIIFELSNSSGNDSPTNVGSNVIIDDLAWGACTSGVEDINNNVTLEPSYPNPANDICNIIFTIPGTSVVNADLYDLNGRKMMNLMNNATLTSGRYKIPVDIRTFANGVYFYTITVDGVSYTQKLVVAK